MCLLKEVNRHCYLFLLVDDLKLIVCIFFQFVLETDCEICFIFMCKLNNLFEKQVDLYILFICVN